MTPEEAAKRIAELEAEVKDLETRLKKISLGEDLPESPQGGTLQKLIWIPWLLLIFVLGLYLYQILAGAGPEPASPPPADCLPGTKTPQVLNPGKSPGATSDKPANPVQAEPEPPLPGLLE